MINATDMAAMQAVSVASLDLACTITHTTSSTDDGLGGTVPGASTSVTITCTAKMPSAGMLAQYSNLIANRKAYRVRVPLATVVSQGDRVVIKSETLTVQVVFAPESYATALLFLATVVE